MNALKMANGYAFALRHTRTHDRQNLREIRRLRDLERALRTMVERDEATAA